MTDFKNHLAFITGGTGDSGAATCTALASLGCNIVIQYHSASSKASTLVTQLRSQGIRADAFQADLSNYASVRDLHHAVVTKMGNPTILFNNAGTTLELSGVKDIEGVSVETFEETWRTNCGSAFLLTQLCIPAMEKAAWGRVIFCSSVAGFTGGVVGPHYASSKSALHGLIHWLSQTYGPKGITTNGIAPALITNTAMLPGNPETLRGKIPIGRLGEPEEVAETVVWMVRTGYVTNKAVGVDGGMFAQ